MIWNFSIIIAVVIIFIILARRIPAAKKLRNETSKASPEEITTYGLIAQADDAFEAKDFEKAEELFVKAATKDPNNAKIYNRLGVIYLEQKNYFDAKDAFSQAIKVEPETASRYVNLGLAYMGLKDYYKATQTFKEAVRLEKRNKKYQGLLERAQKAYEKEKKIKK
jgi:Flp pilus assembly protein TadD